MTDLYPEYIFKNLDIKLEVGPDTSRLFDISSNITLPLFTLSFEVGCFDWFANKIQMYQQ